MTIWRRTGILIVVLLAVTYTHAQSTFGTVDNSYFANQKLLNNLFDKLYNLEKNKRGKINIVHVGDSHIQADLFTNTIRQSLQSKFGNGGYGFTFPYSLIGTNGSRSVRYISNAPWESLRNVSPVADVGVGLSGIALYTPSQDFVLDLTAEDNYRFTTVKIIYPSVESYYKMSIVAEPLQIVSSTKSTVTGQRNHKIKKGESLYSIATKYGTTADKLKKANGLKSNAIHPGKNLKIPGKGIVSKSKVSRISAAPIDDFVKLETEPYCSTYTSDSLLSRITIVPDGQGRTAMYNLNGFVVENDQPGIVYHTIGVNGAKLSDYNKYPLFFKQLPLLDPDLIILSFGTNESFGKLSTVDYINNLKEFIDNVRLHNPLATILVMTPPPSLYRRSRPNLFIDDYSLAVVGLSTVPVWDLYNRMGGMPGIEKQGEYSDLIAKDNVHYTTQGYQTQGSMFLSDFINAYDNYKTKKKN